MILPDVNTLVYAFRRDTEHHEDYAGWLNSAVAGAEPIVLPDVVLTGFLRVVTNGRIFTDPAPARAALSFVEALRASPAGRALNPTNAAWRRLARYIDDDPYLVGNLVPDAWIAALAVASGARVATADAGFARFEGLAWFNPVRDR
ncbi:MAG: type II toxin-antitoxin system VapC family toxin [Acidimicrobiaceae bacterium]|nr:type II toxin-antitoxin system VapC family toxin [Acidimicrobiaceae bacterium]MXZ99436.1 type II toxin-antitoxin system VapC family toxin [Acidimicrobiaceae bacterium]MYE76807.1 type II toxin-antitoxin system VapC family toxin [Acidimicrobiaceae bacterium]MYE96406.1 type II toxin-antitoxin system VapC family toxin [Acidimicrobiaceae bacterium]MYI53611.1 type II toxin-antitoxin system VapC family toxin [Acidimicrobiaceae bacterium]